MGSTPPDSQKVYIVDDDDAMRDSLVWLLESHGLAVVAFPSAEAFSSASLEEMRGCLVLDVRMPGMSGLELYDQLVAKGQPLPTIFVTGHGDVPMAVTALKKGAVDFIEKPFAEKDMLRLIEECLKLERACHARRLEHRTQQGRLASLTQREREVLDLIVAGRLNKQIAFDLGISVKTVEVHRSRVMEKMDVSSVAELVNAVLVGKAEER